MTLIRRNAGMLIADSALAGGCYLAAFLIRIDPVHLGVYIPVMARTLPIVILVAGVSFFATGLYRSLPRYASLDTLIAAARATTVAIAFSALAIFVVWRGAGVPRSVFIIQWMLTFLALGAVRLLPRLRRASLLMPLRVARANRIPVLIYGAGDAGAMIVRQLLDRDGSPYWPVGFIDDDDSKIGRTVHGRPVLGGGADLVRIARESEAREILVAIPSASGADIRRIVERGGQLPGVRVKTLPSISDLLEGRVTVQQFHEVSIDDLLKRAPRDLDRERIHGFLVGKKVFVTGAGGSIGSELCRQIAATGPAELTLFEQSEYNLYAIDRELRERHPELKIRPLLGDASHQASVEPIMRRTRPQIVFHAAAYKHVPMLELNPCEGVMNNVLGIVNTADAALACRAQDFVFVSTDKAVRPVSVMGAAKRVGELYVQLIGQTSDTRFNAVRFGNVLGSSGSVIPMFADLIRRGQPIPITDPRATRYFMLTSEAAQLVLQAGSLGRSGDIFVLDMGDPVNIEELARDLALLMGAGSNGAPEVEIVYTGMRPGEKLEEELFIQPTDRHPTGFGSILVEGWRPSIVRQEMELALLNLVGAARSGDVPNTIRALRELVPEYQPATPTYARILAETPRAPA